MLVNPYMLAALVAIAIPWIIEWLLRRRRRLVELPTIRFLLDTAQRRRVRLQDVVLLLVRSLVILLFVLALTRPIVRPDPLLAGGRKTLQVVLLFDATYSNAQKVGSDTAFSLARKIGSEVIAGLPRGARVTVASLSDDVKVELEGSDDLPAARERVERLEAGDRTGFIVDALDWAEAFAQSRRIGPAEFYILSDMQESTWSRRPGDRRDPRAAFRRLCEKHRVFVADTGGGRATNYYITRLEPLDSMMAVGIPSVLTATVEATNLQPGETHRAELTFYVDGEKRSTQSFVVGAEAHHVAFEHSFLRGGKHLLKAVLRGDDHTMDNVRHYIAAVPESHRVLIVEEGAGGRLFDADSGLLELAVSPPRKPGRDKLSAFGATVCAPEQFSRQDLADYEIVMLANVGGLTGAMVGALESFVAEGGSLMVLLGEPVVPFEYNRRLYKDGQGLLPCAIDETAAPVEGRDLSLAFDPSALAGLAHLLDGNTVEGAIRKYLPLALPADDRAARVLARFSNAAPALVEKPFGRGRVVLFAGSIGLGWGDLSLSEKFPVLVQEVLRHLVGDPGRELNLEVGGRFDQPVLMTSQHLTLRRPDGRKARLTPVNREGRSVRHVSYADTDRAGVYEVDTIPEVLANRRFVVNLVPSEPDLRRLDEPRFELAFGRTGARFLPAPARTRRFVRELHSVKEAAAGLLVAVFLVLAGETYLAFRFGKRRT